MYDIVRFFRNGTRRVLERGVSLDEAKTHCRDPETSSSTATGYDAKRRTAKLGQWFDGYEQSSRSLNRRAERV